MDQAALTGESLPVKKFSGDVAFAGSTIKQGERHCVVYATGMQTFFGRAAALLGATNSVANLQKVCGVGRAGRGVRVGALEVGGVGAASLPALVPCPPALTRPALRTPALPPSPAPPSAPLPLPSAQVMTKIGALCLITIGVWCVIELAVQFGHYNHACVGGEGERAPCFGGEGDGRRLGGCPPPPRWLPAPPPPPCWPACAASEHHV